MRWHTFFTAAASLFRAEPRTKSADGMSEAYQDAMTLSDRLLNQRRVSRREMERRGISQGRYDAACELLKACHLIIVQPGKAPVLAWGVEDIDEVDRALSEYIDELRRRSREYRRYVMPLGD